MSARARTLSARSLLTVAALVVMADAGCGPAPIEVDAALPDASFDAAPSCLEDDDCEDGLACNGEARCELGRCVAGEPIRCDDGVACTTDFCSEELRRCVNRPVDGDADGHPPLSCLDGRGMPLGNDCDDASPTIFPGAMELCDAMGVDEDCDPTTLGGRDGDGDGFVDVACCNGSTCGDDCNDAIRGASPSGTEVCNGIDDDCDGARDEDVQVIVYRDADGDGHGDPMLEMLACATSPGYTAAGDDCDDASALRSPTLLEACDGIDNDCDGTPDPADAPVIVTWYEDADGDGFGDARVSVESCGRPMGAYSLLPTDCDDTTPLRSPGQPEACNGLDDDCNGVADFAFPGGGDLEDDDLDGRADARCVPRPLEPDCDDRDASSGGDAEEICDGRDNDCDGAVDEGVAASAFYRDADGDGHGSEVSGATFGCGAVAGYVSTDDDCDDTSDTRFPGADEGCNARDDDCDARVDEDPSMSMCPLVDGLVRMCIAGRCRSGAPECPSGRADCDGLPANGCEAILASDPTNCGACGRGCATDFGAAAACTGGRCAGLACTGGMLDCDGNLGRGANGCETDGSTDSRNCGTCGTVCGALPHVSRTSCVDGTCGFGAADCDDGWADCNGVVADGCEAQLGTDATCASCSIACLATEECDATRLCRPRMCTAPTADCDGNGSCEANTSTSVAHCGACGSACSGRAANWACTSGRCDVLSCVGTAADCDGLDSTGCEIETATSLAHCGGCGRACAGGSATWTCGSGACRVSSCLGGALDCDAAATNGCEVDGDTDVMHCGGCGVACPREPGTVAPSCALGVCSTPACSSGRNDCNADLGRAGDGCETVGTCPFLTVTPGDTDLGPIAALLTTAPQMYTVRNLGTAATGPLMVEVVGTLGAEFPIVMDGCGGSALAGSGMCTFGVTFAPTSTGPRSALLRVASTPGGIALSTVSGTGLISYAPTMHSFGPVTLGATTGTQSFVIRNPGTVAGGTLTVNMTGDIAEFPIVSDPCTGTALGPGLTCTVTVRFAPTTAGARTATLRAVATAGGLATSALTGVGSLPITVAPTSHGFGAITLGATSGNQTFTISNPGVIPTGPLAVSRVGTNPTDFEIVTDGCSGMTLAAGTGSCAVTLRFNPGAAGARSATLRVAGSPGGSVDSSLTGTGSLPITVAPTSFGFGTITLGGTSGTQTFTISNPGVIPTGALTVSRIGTSPTDFGIVSDGCTGMVLAAGTGTCNVVLQFTPAAAGARSATLRVVGAPGGTADASLTGTGSLPITVTPTTHGFGTVNVTEQSGMQSFSISNPGTITTGTLAVSFIGTDPGDFSVVSDSCSGVALAPTGGCSVGVRFVPTAAGSRSAQLRVAAGAAGGTALATLGGTGSLPITIGPTSHGFGVVTLGATSGTVDLTVSNPGTIATGPLAVMMMGTHPGDFPIVMDSCSTTMLPPAGGCVVRVRFTPAGTGSRGGQLRVMGTPGGTVFSSLSGTGTGQITISPPSLSFPVTGVGSTSPSQSFTIFNPGPAATGALNFSFTGPHASDYSYSTTTCFPLGSGTSCTLNVQLSPTAPGVRSTTVTVSSTPGGSAVGSASGPGLTYALGATQMGTIFGTGSANILDCPAGHAIVGVSGRAGTVTDRLEILCAPLSVSTVGATHVLATGASFVAGGAGGFGGGPYGEGCGPNRVATGIAGANGDSLDRFGVTCGQVSLVPAWSVSIAPTGSTSQYGGGGGGPFSEGCPSGSILTGLYVATGTYVDGVGARCRPVTAVP